MGRTKQSRLPDMDMTGLDNRNTAASNMRRARMVGSHDPQLNTLSQAPAGHSPPTACRGDGRLNKSTHGARTGRQGKGSTLTEAVPRSSSSRFLCSMLRKDVPDVRQLDLPGPGVSRRHLPASRRISTT